MIAKALLFAKLLRQSSEYKCKYLAKSSQM